MEAAFNNGADAPCSIAPRPESDKARWQAGFIGGNGTEVNSDCAGALPSMQSAPDAGDASRERFEDLRAKLALKGKFGLYELADASYIVTMSGYTKSLPDLRAVASFARQVGAAA